MPCSTESIDGDNCDNFWYSYTHGPLHIVAMSTEVLGYWSSIPSTSKERMLRWLRADLTAANKTRHTTPWIVVHYHRPSYSSWGDPENDDKPFKAFDEILSEFQVDVVFSGHVHSNEFVHPVRNNTLVPPKKGGIINATHVIDPDAPVYVVAGNPSNSEETSIFSEWRDWTLWRSYSYGFTTLSVLPDTEDHHVLGIGIVNTATQQLAATLTIMKPIPASAQNGKISQYAPSCLRNSGLFEVGQT
eukprot:CAMPEP_0174275682 /NCGR_PEP_ID=MMETSP0439-20130205/59960_1 /TAXON_ID=0 /ORGANISM="Stereomyxa ramosa, Strain Chinc5" /LENGTH=244 /DNA_ID=CAMNT_0015367815 /DNA_START=2053 /DNA_END=2787 /DNA_ORIENTATION=-